MDGLLARRRDEVVFERQDRQAIRVLKGPRAGGPQEERNAETGEREAHKHRQNQDVHVCSFRTRRGIAGASSGASGEAVSTGARIMKSVRVTTKSELKGMSTAATQG